MRQRSAPLTRALARVSLSLALSLALAAPALLPTAQAKEIQQDASTSQRLTLRVDGLACYFCAYGLERAFRKSGRISAFDIDMDKGLVSLDFAAGQPPPSLADLKKIVHQAGYDARDEVEAALRGHVVDRTGLRYLELVDATGSVALAASPALDAWTGSSDSLVLVTGPVTSDEATPFRVTPTSITITE